VTLLAGLLRTLTIAAFALLWAPSVRAEPGVVIYPTSGVADDQRSRFYISLLQIALDKGGGGLQARESAIPSVTLRTFERMVTGNGIDVVWAPTTAQLERDYLPVRVPLDKGVLGWRIFLVNRTEREKFADVHSMEQLKALSAGQAGEWVDTQILRHNGMTVVESTLYETLFKMLAGHRFDYMPRGIAEIIGEASNYAHLGLEIEPRLALHYPFCTYFFVAPGNGQLAQQLERGLRKAQSDGSFERLFQQYMGREIAAARLDKRLVFELDNPTLPPRNAPGQAECRSASTAIARAR